MFFDKWGSDSWKIRRRLVFMTELYCATAVGYLIIWGPDDELRRAAVNGLILLAGATLQGYVFGVIFDKTQVQPAGSTTETKQTVVTAPPEQTPKVEIKEPAADLTPPKGFAEN